MSQWYYYCFVVVIVGMEPTFLTHHSFVCIRLISRSNWIYSGMETLLLGGACATLAFTIGKYVNNLVGEDEDVGIP